MTMTSTGVKPAIENNFMEKPGRWGGPDCSGSGLPPRGSKGWLEARLARSASSTPANQPGPSAEARTQRSEAEQLAYVCGIAGVVPIAQRLIDLEQVVAELLQTIQRIESKKR
jgi:hypothetical protein